MNKQTFNQGALQASGSEDKSPFEILLTSDQFKLLQKILPVGYSLSVADKYTRGKHKGSKFLEFEFGREDIGKVFEFARRLGLRLIVRGVLQQEQKQSSPKEDPVQKCLGRV